MQAAELDFFVHSIKKSAKAIAKNNEMQYYINVRMCEKILIYNPEERAAESLFRASALAL